MNKKTTARRRNMRNTVIMALLCVALLGSATYAWFTMSKTAQITNLSIGVTETSDLQISGEVTADNVSKPSGYASTFTLFDLSDARMTPATLGADGTILKPVYKTGVTTPTVENYETGSTGLETPDDTSVTPGDTEYHYYEEVFYIRTSAPNKGLILTTASNITNSESNYPALDSLRVAIYSAPLDGTPSLLAVYEPSWAADATTWGNVDKADDKAKIELAADATATWEGTSGNLTWKQLKNDTDGKFYQTGTDEGVAGTESIFSLTENADNRFIMRVYFDGNDPDSCNIISGDVITGTIEFSTVDVAAAETP